MILLVDDDAAIRDSLSNELRAAGYPTTTAVDGADGVRLFRAGPPDLVVTDMVMPNGISGAELASRCRGDRPQLKVLYTSGYSVELTDGDLPLHDGVNFLPKPYQALRLATVVRNCLDAGVRTASVRTVC